MFSPSHPRPGTADSGISEVSTHAKDIMSDSEKPTAGATEGVDGGAYVADTPPHEGMSAVQYMRTRFTSLKPPMTKLANPFKLMRMLTGHHWAFFGVAFFAWVCRGYSNKLGSRSHGCTARESANENTNCLYLSARLGTLSTSSPYL